jgi:flagellar biosynthesis protein FlhF
VEKALQNVDYVLLDTPGVNLRSPDDMERLRQVLPPNMQGMNVHFVQSALARDADAFEVADRFKAIGFDDVIFTRLDEAVQHGIIYNFQKRFHVPLHSFGIGSAIPEDYEIATKERVVDLIFQLSKLRKERGTP